MMENKSKAVKILLSLFLVLSIIYFNALMIFGIISSKSEIFYYLGIVVLSFVDLLLFIIAICRYIGKRRGARFTSLDFDSILRNAPCPNYQTIEHQIPDDDSSKKEAIDMQVTDINEAVEVDTAGLTDSRIYDDAPEEIAPIAMSNSFDIKSIFDDLAKGLINFSASQGIKVDYSSVRNLFSAMASNRLILIKCDNLELVKGFLKAMNSFIASSLTFTYIQDDFNKPADLYYQIMNGLRYKSEFIKSLYYANSNPDGIHIATLENVNLDSIESWFHEVYPILDNNVENHQIILHTKSGDITYNFPANLWLFAVLNKDSKLFGTKFLARNSAIAEIRLESCEPIDFDDALLMVSYEHLQTLVVSNSENYFIPEENYKRLDKLIDFIKQKTFMIYGNKEECSLEDYVSTFMSMGGTASEALDSAMASKIIPYALSDENSKAFKDDLLRLIDKEFGMDNTLVTERIIKLS